MRPVFSPDEAKRKAHEHGWDLLLALEAMIRATESWNASVEKIIGRQPQTGIDLQHAKRVAAKARGDA